VAVDSGFVLAWAQLSRTLTALYFVGTPTPETERRALEAAEHAVRLGPAQFAGHLALGDYYSTVPVRSDLPRALQEYQAGLRLAPDNGELLAAIAGAETRTGHWEGAVGHLTRALELDPRSQLIARRLTHTYLRLRRYPEASRALDHLTELSPGSLGALLNRVMLQLAQGDLAHAQADIRAASPGVDAADVAAFLGNYFDLYWALPRDLQDLLLRLPPSAYGDDRGVWGIVRAETYHLRGDLARTRIYADSAREALEELLRTTPDDPQRRAFHGVALAYLGRKAEAIAEGERAMALVPMAKNGYDGPYMQHMLVRTYLLVGEPGKALDRLEPLLKVPYYLSPGWLRIDPTFDPLRNNPRFKKLVDQTS
jgi:serine/threonine-protein kinase